MPDSDQLVEERTKITIDSTPSAPSGCAPRSPKVRDPALVGLLWLATTTPLASSRCHTDNTVAQDPDHNSPGILIHGDDRILYLDVTTGNRSTESTSYTRCSLRTHPARQTWRCRPADRTAAEALRLSDAPRPRRESLWRVQPEHAPSSAKAANANTLNSWPAWSRRRDSGPSGYVKLFRLRRPDGLMWLRSGMVGTLISMAACSGYRTVTALGMVLTPGLNMMYLVRAASARRICWADSRWLVPDRLRGT